MTLMLAPALAATPAPELPYPNLLPTLPLKTSSQEYVSPLSPGPQHSPLVSEQLLPAIDAPFRASAPASGYLVNLQAGATTVPERGGYRAEARARRKAAPGRQAPADPREGFPAAESN